MVFLAYWAPDESWMGKGLGVPVDAVTGKEQMEAEKICWLVIKMPCSGRPGSELRAMEELESWECDLGTHHPR